MLRSRYNRTKTFVHFDRYGEMIPGEWDRLPNQPSLDDKVNRWLEETSVVLVAPSDFNVKLVEQRDGGKVRVFMSTLALTYIPDEIINHADQQNSESAAPPAAGSESPAKSPVFIPFNGREDFQRVAGSLGIPEEFLRNLKPSDFRGATAKVLPAKGAAGGKPDTGGVPEQS